MKIWLMAILILSGCSSKKKDKDFQKSLDQPNSVTPEAQVKAPEKLLEKFEVVKIESVPAPAPAVAGEKPKKNAPLIVKTEKGKQVVKPALPLTLDPPVHKLPSDYPAALTTLNGKAEQVWKLYKSNHYVNEKVFLDIHYLGMTVGKIMVTNRGKKLINGKEVWHFHSRFKSAPFYSNIYELDDTVDTYVTTDQFLSTRYSLIQRESKQDVDDLQLHDRDQMKTFWFYKQKKADGTIKNKEKKAFIPYFSIDPFSMLFFFQGLPLNNGDIYHIPIINKGKILILKSEVEGREEIDTEIGDKQKAIRVHATTQYSGETLKSGDIYLWFSDDKYHKLLKAQAKIKIGSVTADIVEEQ
ncbi:MAG: DUF3108 domain-containing protein [Bdellovibrionales bacterium]|nr:DUF3108 domain-containing protein [Bdellovibrionales bacterium]